MLVGITLGVLIGVLPGLGGANGVAILLPLTFSDEPDLGHHHAAASTGARCSAGPSPRSCSTFRASRGRWPPPSTATRWRSRAVPREALTAAFTSSFVGAFVAVLLITFLAPMVAKFALKFGRRSSLPCSCSPSAASSA
jgi:putative tricarboxylic transport membrane protein